MSSSSSLVSFDAPYHRLDQQQQQQQNNNNIHENNNNHNDDDNTSSSINIWDQLNDAQSREVQQHQSRFHRMEATSRQHPWTIAGSMVWNTFRRTGMAMGSAWIAAQRTWYQYPLSTTATSHRNRNRNQHPFLDWDEEFGIQELRVPLSSMDEFNNNDGDDDHDDHDHHHRGRGRQSQQPQQQQPNPGYPFVVLKQYPSRKAIENEQDHWGIVNNMDVFLQQIYKYYYHRGIQPMMCQFVVEFISLIVTVWLSRILLYKVDWNKLITMSCEGNDDGNNDTGQQEQSQSQQDYCYSHWSDYYYYYETPQTGTIRWLLVQGYTILFVGYAMFSAWDFWQSIQQAWKCQYLLHDKLGISRRKLQGGAVTWDAIVQALMDAQESGLYKMAIDTPTGTSTSTTTSSPSPLDPLIVAQRILRKENFLLAFWNQGLLDVEIGGRQYWCPTLEWSLHVCVLNFMFNHKYELRPAFVLDVTSLERRLIVCGIVHAILLPFLMVFVTLHFLFKNVYDFKTSQQYLGNKQWSNLALWKFREFNELPHVLEQRLEPSYAASHAYLNLFGQSEVLAACGKLLVFLGGTVGGLLLVLGVLNDEILLHVQLWGRNLLWYAGMAGIAYSIGKGLVPTKEAQPSVSKNLFADMDAALKQVASHTHYYPEHWKGRGWDTKVHSQFQVLFDSKLKLFLWELISLVLAPYLLIGKLSKCAPQICQFCMTIKAKVPGAGDVCGYSTFDFDTFKDEAWDGRTMGASVVNMPNNDDDDGGQPQVAPQESLAESILRTGNLEEATRQHPKPRAKDGKMEKSFFGFQAAHPSWKCTSPSGQSLMNRVEEYRQAELAAAMSKERDLYIEAAARQLETLAQMETLDGDNTTMTPTNGHTGNSSSSRKPSKVRFAIRDRIDEAHHGPADADAGTHPSPRIGPMTSPSTAPPSSSPSVPPAPATTTTTTTANQTSPLSHSMTETAFHSSRNHNHHNSNNSTQRDTVDEADQGSSSMVAMQQPIRGGGGGAAAASSTVSFPVTTSSASLHHPIRQQGYHLQRQTLSDGNIMPLPSHDPLVLAGAVTTAAAAAATSTTTENSTAALRAGLSTELRRLLTLSTPTLDEHSGAFLTSSSSSSPSSLHPSSAPVLDRTAERQYYWLERFHQHLESQQQQQQQQQQETQANNRSADDSASATEPHISRSLPTTLGGTAMSQGSPSRGGRTTSISNSHHHSQDHPGDPGNKFPSNMV